MIGKHAALVYTLVLMSEADGAMSDAELQRMTVLVQFLPVFRDFDLDDMRRITTECMEMLQREDGLDLALGQVKAALSPGLRETAYVLACDVAAADGAANQEELRLLEIMRDRLGIDPLVAAAIERSARARAATA